MHTGTLQAIRAIGSEFAMRLWRPLLYFVILTTLMSAFALAWLTSMNSWWWLLALPLFVGLSVTAGLLGISLLVIRRVQPHQHHDQKRRVQEFVDKLQRIQEFSGTPTFIILFRTIRSITQPPKDKYLSTLLSAKDLASDFATIAKSFKN